MQGYMNVGIASKKEKAESISTHKSHKYKLLGEKKFEGNSGSSATDSADGVSFILGQVKNPHELSKSEDGIGDNDENFDHQKHESSTPGLFDELPYGEHGSSTPGVFDEISVIVLVAGTMIGGCVRMDHSSHSVPLDLGASIITRSFILGVEADLASGRRPDPSSLVCSQLGLGLTALNNDCPLYDIITVQKVPVYLMKLWKQNFQVCLMIWCCFMSLYALMKRHIAHVGADTSEVDTVIRCLLPHSGTDPGDSAFPERKEFNTETLNYIERRLRRGILQTWSTVVQP